MQREEHEKVAVILQQEDTKYSQRDTLCRHASVSNKKYNYKCTHIMNNSIVWKIIFTSFVNALIRQP